MNAHNAPSEIIYMIFDYLDDISLILGGYTCSKWYQVSQYMSNKRNIIHVNMLRYACEHGYSDLFHYLIAKGEVIDWEVFEGAEEYFIKNNACDLMLELITASVATGRHTNKAILIFRLWPGRAASRLGGPNSIKLLNKLCSIGYLPTNDFNEIKHIWRKILEDICILACRHGNTEILQWVCTKYKKLIHKMNKSHEYDTFIVTCLHEAASESHIDILNMLKNIFEMTAGTPGSLSYDNEIYPIPKKHHYKVVRRYTCVHRNNSKEDTVPCRIYGEAMHNGDLKVLKWYRNHSILRAFYAAEFRAA